MKHAEFSALQNDETNILVGVAQLINRTPRTLLYGATSERYTWHVYLGVDQAIHKVVYSSELLVEHTSGPFGGVLANQEYLRVSQLYAESCDYEFCRCLRYAGERLCLTSFEEGHDEKRKAGNGGAYAGKTYEELQGLHSVALSAAELIPPEHVSTLGSLLLEEAARMRGVTYRKEGNGFLGVPPDRKEEVLAQATALTLHRQFDAMEIMTLAQHAREPEGFLRQLFRSMDLSVQISEASVCGATVSAKVQLLNQRWREHSEVPAEEVGKGRYRLRNRNGTIDVVLVQDESRLGHDSRSYQVHANLFGDAAEFAGRVLSVR
jgi:PAS domain-containing protein